MLGSLCLEGVWLGEVGEEGVGVACGPGGRAAGGYLGLGWRMPDGLLTVRWRAAAFAAAALIRSQPFVR